MSNDPTPADGSPPRRRRPAAAVLAAGALATVALGLGGMAFAAEEPAAPPAPSTSAPSTPDGRDGGADDELCEKDGRGPSAPDSATPESSADSVDV